ncbi:MAG TPA: DNA-formamidopyrimidine glycosylase family protein, partial [Patescibacteria group bacterium]|nr:DNA-formamidopyrimidine glycosylase family protein [Patescibacteria group bacterium]
MPELPEVETVVRELNRKLKGRTIRSVSVVYPKSIVLGPQTVSPKRVPNEKVVKEFIKHVTGLKFLSAKRRAKLIIFDLSGPF